MGMFDALTNAITTGKEQYSAAKDSAYEYADSKITEYQKSAKDTLNELDEGASYLDAKIRDGADELVDDISNRNQEFYTDMKDDINDNVSVVSETFGMGKTGQALNEKIDSAADSIQSAGETLTTLVHEEVKNIGTLNRERKFANTAIDTVPTGRIENETGRQLAMAAKSKVKNIVNTNLTDVPLSVAKTGVDGVALTLKTEIAMRDPFPNPDDIEIGQTKIIGADFKIKAHEGVGGGVGIGQQFATERHGEDDYEITVDFNASAKVGVGFSAADGIDANLGSKLSTRVTVRGSADMLEALKENYKNGEPLTMESLQKMSPEEIKVGGAINHFVDGSTFVVSNQVEMGIGAEAVWTKKEGLHAQLTANAKVSPQIGGSFATDLPGNKLDMPNLAASFELSGTVKTDGKLELKASAQGAKDGNTITAEATTTIDLTTIGMSKEEALALINKGDFNPNDFGIKLDFKVHTTKVIDGGISFDTSFGGIKNQVTQKELLHTKQVNVLQRANLRF